MAGENRSWAHDFFGPLWAWLLMGAGFLLMTSTFGLQWLGVAGVESFIPFGVGIAIVVTIMTYLAIEGRKTWSAYFWPFHLDDADLIMGRKKND